MIDPYLWLEDLESPEASRWVAERNAETLASLGGEEFARLKDAVREVLDSKERISFPAWRGDGYYYDFWKDADHPRGVWRRTTLEQFRRDEPEWDVLLDVGALNEAEGENWTWQSATVLRPGYDRCLVSLARGGSDAAVVREFDMVNRVFVEDGFVLPEAKTDVGWIDADHIFVATDFGPGSLTSSGYARIAKAWRRGTPLSEAETVFEGDPDDVLITAVRDPAEGFVRDFVVQRVEFFSTRYFLRTGDRLVRIPIPEDAGFDVHREWMVVRLRSPWLGFPAGALIATNFDDFLAGGQDFTVLFQPDEHTSLTSYHWTLNHLLLVTMTDVVTRVQALTPGGSGWSEQPLPSSAEFGTTWIVDTDPDHSDAYLIASEGFLQPATLSLGSVGGDVTVLKRAPSFFATDGMTVRQFFAVSDDGTRVPYFVVGRPDDSGPVWLTGYGGFEIPMTPNYGGVRGRGWLARGGTFVLANIRGGGEYGPAWHQAALRENRPRAYEDFAAVARDLVSRGIATPGRLGVTGGSNGGLLMGVMLTRYPDLFGAVVAGVPLLDMRRYTKLLAGKSWIAEYGDPDVEDDWAFIREYSPYQNVRPDRTYPPILFITSTRDDRVHPGHARKMLALLRDQKHETFLYENVEGGHGAAADNEQAATKEALTLEFLWRELNRTIGR
ncbi:prolyl oligopeptidase family serine peptidase [Actinoplanes sp. NPDC023714]|uniref:prolyl oligopeptidase family serine peptidase n=1 Tax=Actinoplanes sp. NPDC023714 TaxID=3154322 RepID=UPI0033EDF4FC